MCFVHRYYSACHKSHDTEQLLCTSTHNHSVHAQKEFSFEDGVACGRRLFNADVSIWGAFTCSYPILDGHVAPDSKALAEMIVPQDVIHEHRLEVCESNMADFQCEEKGCCGTSEERMRYGNSPEGRNGTSMEHITIQAKCGCKLYRSSQVRKVPVAFTAWQRKLVAYWNVTCVRCAEKNKTAAQASQATEVLSKTSLDQ